MKPVKRIYSTLLQTSLALLAGTLVVRGDNPYPTAVLSQNPVGYWRLDETTAPQYYLTPANSGSFSLATPASYHGLPPRGLAGPFTGSSAVGLDGASQAITTPWQSGENTSAFSVELWANPAIVPYSGSVAYLAASAHLATTRSGWYLAQDNGGTFQAGSAFVVRMFNQNGTASALQLSAPVSVTGWYHLVLTYDGNTASLYTNGVLAMSGTPTTYNGNKYVPNVDSDFSVGWRSDGGFPWPGKVAEVATYGSALSAARVAAHYSTAINSPGSYASTVTSDSALLYYRFKEPSDVVVAAANEGSLGTAANGNYESGTTPGNAGPRPSPYNGFESTNVAVTVNGTGGAVSVPALNLKTNAVTICGWVNADGSQPAAAGIFVDDSANTYAGLTIDGLNGGLGLGYVWNDNDPNTYNWSPTADSFLPTLNSGEWAFVALVIQPSEADIYISSPTIPFTAATNYLQHTMEAFDGASLIGSDDNVASVSFKGSIDEVAVFNYSLSAGQLYSQYATGIGGLAPQIFSDLTAPTLFVGDTLSLMADIGGTEPISYQWYNASGAIAGATNRTYVKPDAGVADNGSYHVVATNPYGSATSATVAISLTPTTTPIIDVPPASKSLYPGATLILNVVAEGGGLKYQWNKGGAPVPGANAATLTITNITAAAAGIYTVGVTNNSGGLLSAPATVIVTTPPTNSYAAAVVADAPEAWYRLDETVGSAILHDSMGRHDGLYTNTTGGSLPVLGAGGAVVGDSDTAASFDGAFGVGIVPYSAALNSEQFTIEAWAKTSVNKANMTVVSSHDSAFKGYGLWQYPSGFWAGEVSDTQDYYVGSDVAAAGVVAGQWTHLVMTYATNSGLRVYINGQWDGNSYVDFTRNTATPFVIGGFGPTPIQYPFNGQIDEVAVYTYPLTLTQAQNHYSRARFVGPIAPFFVLVPQSDQLVSNSAATTTLTGQADGPLPITYQWYFNGTAITGATNTSLTVSDTYSNAGSYVLRAINLNGYSNATAATLAVLPPNPPSVNITNGLVLHLKFDGNYQDSSGRGHNGTPAGYNGGTPSFVSGRLGSGAVHYVTDTDTGIPYNSNTNAVVTDSSYVTLGNPADLQFSTNVDFSVSYWVRLPAGYLNGDLPFFSSAAGSTFNTGFTFAPGYTNGGFGYSFNGLGEEGTPSSLNDGNWHHMLFSVNRSGTEYAYLDGQVVDSALATTIGNMTTAGPINIGQDPTGQYPEQGSADIDDLAVWRRALTSYEAYAVYYAATNSNASFDLPGNPIPLVLQTSGSKITLTWTPGATLGTLLQADDLTGPWTPAGAYTPSFTITPTAAHKFYRLSFP